MGYTATKMDQHLVDWAENLDDISYDGQLDPSHAVAGLGQLADGIITDNRTSTNGTFFGKSLSSFCTLKKSIKGKCWK